MTWAQRLPTGMTSMLRDAARPPFNPQECSAPGGAYFSGWNRDSITSSLTPGKTRGKEVAQQSLSLFQPGPTGKAPDCTLLLPSGPLGGAPQKLGDINNH